MDEQVVRDHAEAHGRAVLAGDLARASEDLTEEGQARAPEVMRKLPRPVTGVEVMGVSSSSEEVLVRLRYDGEGASTEVESRWVERDGRPMISDLRVM